MRIIVGNTIFFLTIEMRYAILFVGIPTIGGFIMPTAVREYDARLDSKGRFTVRNSGYDYYHVSELEDGVIILEPRVLTAPFSISANTLNMMDTAVQNLREGEVSAALDLSEFE